MPVNEVEIAGAHLDRTLDFFARVDAKASILFGINVGIITLLLFNLDPKDLSTWYAAVPLVATFLLIIWSTANLLLASYPSLKGGASSLFYFGSVGARTEQDYVRSFKQASDDDLLSDLLGQVWRNSQILKEKYERVTSAFRQTAYAVVPWAWFLIASAMLHGRGINLGS